jgi:hypothetical protein
MWDVCTCVRFNVRMCVNSYIHTGLCVCIYDYLVYLSFSRMQIKVRLCNESTGTDEFQRRHQQAYKLPSKFVKLSWQ